VDVALGDAEEGEGEDEGKGDAEKPDPMNKSITCAVERQWS
jgi:hypothetical protein